jgi:hypothetical protein
MKKLILLVFCFMVSGSAFALEGYEFTSPGSMAVFWPEMDKILGKRIDKNKPIEVVFYRANSTENARIHPVLSELFHASLREQGFTIADEKNPAEQRLALQATITINNRKNMYLESFFDGMTLADLDPKTPNTGAIYGGPGGGLTTAAIHASIASGNPLGLGAVFILGLASAIVDGITVNSQMQAHKSPIEPCGKCDKSYNVKTRIGSRLEIFVKETKMWRAMYGVAVFGSGELDKVPLLAILEESLQTIWPLYEDGPTAKFPEELVAAAVYDPLGQEAQAKAAAEAAQTASVEAQPEIPAAPAPASDEPHPSLAE